MGSGLGLSVLDAGKGIDTVSIQIWMAWRMVDKKPLEQNVQEAISYFEEKYQVPVRSIRINPADASPLPEYPQMEVRVDETILRGELWVSPQTESNG